MVRSNCVALFLGLSLAGYASWAQDTKEEVLLPKFKAVPVRGQLLQGEPAVVAIELLNDTGQEVKLALTSNERLESADMVISLHDGSGQEVMRQSLHRGSKVYLAFPAFRPGQALRSKVMFLPSKLPLQGARQEREVLAPGQYGLKVSLALPLEGGTRNVLADAGQIEIVEAAGADKEAAKLMFGPEMVGFVNGSRGGKPQPALDLLTRFPDSICAFYVRTRLLLDELHRFWQTKRSGNLSEDEKAQLRKLIADSLAHADKHPQAAFTDTILLQTARMYRILRDGEHSKVVDTYLRTMERVIKNYPHSEARETAVAEVTKMGLKVTPEGNVVKPDTPPDH